MSRLVCLQRVTERLFPDDVLELHPNAAKRYGEKEASIREALRKGDAAGQEAVRLAATAVKRQYRSV